MYIIELGVAFNLCLGLPIHLGLFRRTSELFYIVLRFWVQNWSKTANGGCGVIFPKFEPEISHLDQIQAVFDVFLNSNFLNFRGFVSIGPIDHRMASEFTNSV